jgi:hypothetical protein
MEVQEIGTDGIIQLAPSSATKHTLSLDRVVFDFQRLPQALQREYRHIHAQRRPFNIIVTDYNPYLGAGATNSESDDTNGSGGGGSLSSPAGGTLDLSGHKVETVFVNCWFTSMDFTYSANDYKISEKANLTCEHVYDVQETVTVQGPVDSLERQTNTAKNASVLSAYDSIRNPEGYF